MESVCNMTAPIKIYITVPGDASMQFISESSHDFGGCLVETNTKIVRDYSLSNKVFFQAFFPADQSFPVRFKVDRNGEMVEAYEGFSNEVVTGKRVIINANNGSIDTVLTAEYDEVFYTYYDIYGY